MIDQIISAVASWIVDVISATGYFGVVILMAIESACIPLPSEVIMPFAGYLVSTGQFSLIGAATAGALGCNLGSTIAYYVAAYGGRPVLERWGEYVLISPAEIKRADEFFLRYGSATVFFGRLLPVVRTFVSIVAGFIEIPPVLFGFLSLIGTAVWVTAISLIGYGVGSTWQSVAHGIAVAGYVIAVVVVIAIGGFIAYRLREVRREAAERLEPVSQGEDQPRPRSPTS